MFSSTVHHGSDDEPVERLPGRSHQLQRALLQGVQHVHVPNASRLLAEAAAASGRVWLAWLSPVGMSRSPSWTQRLPTLRASVVRQPLSVPQVPRGLWDLRGPWVLLGPPVDPSDPPVPPVPPRRSPWPRLVIIRYRWSRLSVETYSTTNIPTNDLHTLLSSCSDDQWEEPVAAGPSPAASEFSVGTQPSPNGTGNGAGLGGVGNTLCPPTNGMPSAQ